MRAEVGYPPLVTPMSQIVGTQSVFNVLTGKRWSVISKEMKDYIAGYYGKAPGKIDPAIQKAVLGDEQPLAPDVAPGSLVTTTYDELAEELGDLAKSEEDVLMYAMFPNEARQFLEKQRKIENTNFLMNDAVSITKEEDYVDIAQIRDLVKLVEESGVGEITVEEAGRQGHHSHPGHAARYLRPGSRHAPGRFGTRCGGGSRTHCRFDATGELEARYRPDGRHLLRRAFARRRSLRDGGRNGWRRRDAVHRRGHEAHERDCRRGGVRRARGLHRQCRTRRVRHRHVLRRAHRRVGKAQVANA